MKQKITKSFVDGFPPADKPQVVFDVELPGFAIKVLPSGRKVYQMRYRMGGATLLSERTPLGRTAR